MWCKKKYHHPWLEFSELQQRSILSVSSQIEDGGDGFSTGNEFDEWW